MYFVMIPSKIQSNSLSITIIHPNNVDNYLIIVQLRLTNIILTPHENFRNISQTAPYYRKINSNMKTVPEPYANNKIRHLSLGMYVTHITLICLNNLTIVIRRNYLTMDNVMCIIIRRFVPHTSAIYFGK